MGMSGGTDSSVAALLLQDAGYEVTGVTFRFYEKDGNTEYLDDARDLCARLGIPHLISDQREAFRTTIIDYFIREYMAGHTPVPCTLCNNYLKWPLLRQLADERGIYHLATGHYVRKRMLEGYWHISTGADADKDQSFFLWGLPQDIMERMLLPMGDLTKIRVREIAEERGFLKAATKKDSIGVCFCPMDYRTFLRNNVSVEDIQKGKFFDEKGNFIAWHEGYPFYTIGQRRGLGIDLNRAVFVKEIIPSENKVVLGDLKSLEKMEMRLKDWNIINPAQLLDRDDVIVKIRYRKQANHCRVTLLPDNAGSAFSTKVVSCLDSVLIVLRFCVDKCFNVFTYINDRNQAKRNRNVIFGVKKTKLQETLVVYICTIEYCISANNTC